MRQRVRTWHGAAQLAAVAAVALLAPSASADDGFVLAQSTAHKLKVLAEGGAAWCGPRLSLRMALEAGSPDAGNAAAQIDMLNRLKTPIETDCAAASSADVAVFEQDKPQGT
jgi:hypothetical protein